MYKKTRLDFVKRVYYATLVWDPHYKCDIRRLEGVQRAAERFRKSNHRYTFSVSIMC